MSNLKLNVRVRITRCGSMPNMNYRWTLYVEKLSTNENHVPSFKTLEECLQRVRKVLVRWGIPNKDIHLVEQGNDGQVVREEILARL